VIGDRRVFDEGPDCRCKRTSEVMPSRISVDRQRCAFMDLAHLDPRPWNGAPQPGGRRFRAGELSAPLTLARNGQPTRLLYAVQQGDALARAEYDDEIAFSAEVAGLKTPASEFNVLDRLWNARVTSHIALKTCFTADR